MMKNRGLTAGTRRIATLAIGACILTSALVLGGASGAQLGDDNPDSDSYIVGFETWPGYDVGDSYRGGTIYHVDDVLKFIGVRSSEPGFKTGVYSDANARFVEPEGEVRTQYTPNDEWFDKLYAVSQISLDTVWNTTLGDTDAAVCIVDTGVRYTHEDLAGGRWLGGYDFVNDDSAPWDDHGHGTHVAGTAAATTNNSVGVAGMGQVGIYGVKVLSASGSGSWTDVASGIRWCADNTMPNTVISMSLGGGPNVVVEDAVKYAVKQGKLVVAAAGNDGDSSWWCGDENCVGYPAAYEDVIAVGCTDGEEALCAFSSRGPQVEVSAPGYGIYSTMGGSDSAYGTMSGTSMSTPHVSGVAALYWSVNTAISNTDLRVCLQNTVEDLGVDGRDRRFGYGELDAQFLFDRCGTNEAPPFDAFASARAVDGVPYKFFQNTHNSTVEEGEPVPCDVTGAGATVWFRWTPSLGGTAYLDTLGSSYDTVVAVYSGSSLADLTPVACNDDTLGSDASALSFEAVTGTTYHIQVAGTNGDVGALDFALDCSECRAPLHDDFENATVAGDSPFTDSVYTDHATMQTGEPALTCGDAQATVWYKWTAPISASVTVDTFNSAFDTVMSAYTGSSLDTLTELACSDDAGSTYGSKLTFNAEAGVTYHFQVGGYGGESGRLEFHVQCGACEPTVPNDERETALTITATPFTHEVDTRDATTPTWARRCYAGNAYIGHDVWYAITPTRDADVTVSTAGSDFDTVIAAANSWGGTFACNDDSGGTVQSELTFHATGGRTYYILAGGFYNASGNLAIDVTCDPACFSPGTVPNDDKAAATSIALLPFVHDQSTVSATMEASEDDCDGRMGASVWFKYRPQVGGIVVADTTGSDFDTVMHAYVYTLGSDRSLGCDDNGGHGGTSKIVFVAIPNQTYHIQVGGYAGAQGNLHLDVKHLV